MGSYVAGDECAGLGEQIIRTGIMSWREGSEGMEVAPCILVVQLIGERQA
jgi:hypothetical protein